MKYIDADRLRVEIERRINSWSIREKHAPVGQGKDTCISRVTELSDLLSFIDSLQRDCIVMEGIAQPDDCEIWVNLKGSCLDVKPGEKIRLIVLDT